MSNSDKDIDAHAATRAEAEAIEWLVLLRSPKLTAQQQQSFFHWLQADPVHQQAFIQVDQLWQRGAAVAEVKPQRQRPQSTPHKAGFLSGWFGGHWVQWGMATACLFAVVTFLLLQPHAVPSQEFRTAAGERKTLELVDGSTITLNVDSIVSVAVGDGGPRKVVLRQGEAFFNVAHDSSRPFAIDTGDGEVVVLGTQFSIRKTAAATQVTVVSGRVQVTPQTTEENTAVVLTANDQSKLSAGQIAVTQVDAEQVLAWREGILRFEGAPLKQVLQELNRYYGVRIELGDDRIGQMKVLAVLPLENDVANNLAILEQNLNLVALRDPATQIIRLLPTASE